MPPAGRNSNFDAKLEMQGNSVNVTGTTFTGPGGGELAARHVALQQGTVFGHADAPGDGENWGATVTAATKDARWKNGPALAIGTEMLHVAQQVGSSFMTMTWAQEVEIETPPGHHGPAHPPA